MSMRVLALSSLLFTSTAAFSAAPVSVGTKTASSATQTNLAAHDHGHQDSARPNHNRRAFLGTAGASAALLFTSTAHAAEMNVDDFLKTGMVMNPMGVGAQANGKGRPDTGVVLREGSEVTRNDRDGGVVAEILLPSTTTTAASDVVLTSFASPWPLAKGSVFDVECRDAASGDGAFLSVTPPLPDAPSGIADVPSDLLLRELFKPTGRFSFYGVPTDVKLKKSTLSDTGAVRFLEVGFSTLSQSTQTEIPRRAIVAATVPAGSRSAVMLTGSATATRWNKKSGNTEKDIRDVVASFQAVPAPKSGLKVRGKARG